MTSIRTTSLTPLLIAFYALSVVWPTATALAQQGPAVSVSSGTKVKLTMGGTDSRPFEVRAATKRDVFIRRASFQDIDYRHYADRGDRQPVTLADLRATRDDVTGYAWLELEGAGLSRAAAPGAPIVDVRFEDRNLVPLGKTERLANNDRFERVRTLVGFSRDVEPGKKELTIDGAAGKVDLTLPALEAHIVAWFDEPKPGSPNPDIANALWIGQRFRVELRYKQEPFFMRRTVKLGVGDVESAPFDLIQDRQDPRVLRSEVTFVAADAAVRNVRDDETRDEAFPVSVGQTLMVRAADASAPDEWHHLPASIYEKVTGRKKTYADVGWAEIVAPPLRTPVLKLVSPGVLTPLPVLTDEQPFQIELHVPRAAAARLGETVTATFTTKNDSATKVLTSKGLTQQSLTGPIVYRIPVQERPGAPLPIPMERFYKPFLELRDHLLLQQDLGLSYENGETMTVSAGGVTTSAELYHLPVNAAVGAIRKDLETLKRLLEHFRDNYDAILSGSEGVARELGEFLPAIDVTSDKLSLQRRIDVAANGLAILNDAALLDPTKVSFGEMYLGILEDDRMRSWRFFGRYPHQQRKVIAGSIEEHELLSQATNEAHNRRADRIVGFLVFTTKLTHDSLALFGSIGYSVWVLASIYPDIDSRGLNGEKLQTADRVLAAVGLASVSSALIARGTGLASRYQSAAARQPKMPWSPYSASSASAATRPALVASSADVGRLLKDLGLLNTHRAEYALRQGLSANAVVAREAMVARLPVDDVAAALGVDRVTLAGLLDDAIARTTPMIPSATRLDDVAAYTGNPNHVLQARERAAADSLQRMGVAADDATAAALGVWRNQSLEDAIIEGAYMRRIPAARLMREMNLTDEQLAFGLSENLRKHHKVASEAERAAIVGRYLRDEPIPTGRPSTLSDTEFSQQMMQTLEQLGAQRTWERGFKRGFSPDLVHERVPQSTATVGGAWQEGVPAVKLIEQLKMDPARIALELDDYLFRVQGVTSGEKRASVIYDFLKDRTPKGYQDRVWESTPSAPRAAVGTAPPVSTARPATVPPASASGASRQTRPLSDDDAFVMASLEQLGAERRGPDFFARGFAPWLATNRVSSRTSAIVGGAWQEGVASAKVMSQLKLDQAAMRSALDEYLLKVQGVSNPTKRQAVVKEFIEGTPSPESAGIREATTMFDWAGNPTVRQIRGEWDTTRRIAPPAGAGGDLRSAPTQFDWSGNTTHDLPRPQSGTMSQTATVIERRPASGSITQAPPRLVGAGDTVPPPVTGGTLSRSGARTGATTQVPAYADRTVPELRALEQAAYQEAARNIPGSVDRVGQVALIERRLNTLQPREFEVAVTVARTAQTLGIPIEKALRHTALHARRQGVTPAELLAEIALDHPQSKVSAKRFMEATGLPHSASLAALQRAAQRFGVRLAADGTFPEAR